MPRRLLIVSFSPIASDARVLKQLRRLAGEYEVHTIGYGPQPDGVASHIAVPEQFSVWQYDRASLILRRFDHAYWTNRAIDFARKALVGSTWDAVLANDIDSVGLALSLESRHGVHADLHEYSPRQKEDVTRWRIFVAPFMRWMCRRFVARADSVTTVGQGIADAYRREFGIRAEVVTNAAPFSELEPTPVGSPIRLVHSGAALRDRNIVTILDAVEAATADVRLDLYLTANDPGLLDEVRMRAAASGRITLHDPVPYSQLSRTLNGYDIGIHILPPVNFNNTWALPNKFFDYVQARLGLIIGPSPEMAAIVRANGLGAVTEGFDVAALTQTINALDPAAVTKWKQGSAEAAPRLSSEAQVEVWARAIEDLMGDSR